MNLITFTLILLRHLKRFFGLEAWSRSIICYEELERWPLLTVFILPLSLRNTDSLLLINIMNSSFKHLSSLMESSYFLTFIHMSDEFRFAVNFSANLAQQPLRLFIILLTLWRQILIWIIIELVYDRMTTDSRVTSIELTFSFFIHVESTLRDWALIKVIWVWF